MSALVLNKGRSCLDASTRWTICAAQVAANARRVGIYFPLLLIFMTLWASSIDDSEGALRFAVIGMMGVALGLSHSNLTLSRTHLRLFGLTTSEIRVQIVLGYAIMAVVIHATLALIYTLGSASSTIGAVWGLTAIIGLVMVVVEWERAKIVESSRAAVEEDHQSASAGDFHGYMDPWREVIARPVYRTYKWGFGIVGLVVLLASLGIVITALVRGEEADPNLLSYGAFLVISVLAMVPETIGNLFAQWLGLSQSRREFRWGVHRLLLPLIVLLPLLPLIYIAVYESARLLSSSFADNNPGIAGGVWLGVAGVGAGIGAVAVFILPNIAMMKLNLSPKWYWIGLVLGTGAMGAILVIGGHVLGQDANSDGSVGWTVGAATLLAIALIMLPVYRWALSKTDVSRVEGEDMLGIRTE